MHPTSISGPVVSRAVKLAYLAIPVWGFSMTCIKISAIIALLRIPIDAYWRPFLFAIAAVQVAYLIGSTVFIFLACIPLQGIWDFSTTPKARCLGMEAPRIASNIGSGINISTDVLLSLAPMFFLWKMRRPLRERILVCGVTGIGLLASFASLIKAIRVRKWGEPDVDPWAVAISIATWTLLEQFLAVMAVCSPSLEGPLHRVLKSLGIFLTNHSCPVELLEARKNRLGSALTADQKDVVGNTGLSVPSPVHGSSEESMKTYFTLSRSTRSRSDPESGSSCGSRDERNELSDLSFNDSREEGLGRQEVAPDRANS